MPGNQVKDQILEHENTSTPVAQEIARVLGAVCQKLRGARVEGGDRTSISCYVTVFFTVFYQNNYKGEFYRGTPFRHS